MNAFPEVTPFRLVRRLAAVGLESPSMYMLICDARTRAAIETDLAAEIDVQLGVELRIATNSDWEREKENGYRWGPDGPALLLRLEEWSPKLIGALDLDVTFLEKSFAIFLLLTTMDLAEKTLESTPNFRNRLTDIVQIIAEEPFGVGDH